MKLIRLLIGAVILTTSCIISDPIQNWDTVFNFHDGVFMRWRYRLFVDGQLYTDVKVELKHIGYEVKDGYYCKKFVAYYVNSSTISAETAYVWYSNSDTGLILVDIEGEHVPMPVFRNDPDGVRYRIGNRTFHSLGEIARFMNSVAWGGDGEPTQLLEPQLTLKYPPDPGSRWIVFTSPWLRTREIVGIEEVDVPAGEFYTLHLKTYDEGAPDLTIDDWITGEAWVKKVVSSKVAVYDDQGRFIKFVTMTDISELEEIGWGEMP